MTTQKIHSIYDVTNKLQVLNKTLSKSKTTQLLPFNQAYTIITNHFIQAMSLNAFEDAAAIEWLDIVFANYYFRTIDDPNNAKSIAWKSVLKLKKNETNFIALLVGANVHINHDLALALLEASKVYEVSKRDFDVSDKVFFDCRKEILSSLKIHQKTKSKFVSILLALPQKLVIRMIIRWRHSAWRNYQGLMSGSLQSTDLIKRADRTTKRLLRLRPLAKLVR